MFFKLSDLAHGPLVLSGTIIISDSSDGLSTCMAEWGPVPAERPKTRVGSPYQHANWYFSPVVAP